MVASTLDLKLNSRKSNAGIDKLILLSTSKTSAQSSILRSVKLQTAGMPGRSLNPSLLLATWRVVETCETGFSILDHAASLTILITIISTGKGIEHPRPSPQRDFAAIFCKSSLTHPSSMMIIALKFAYYFSGPPILQVPGRKSKFSKSGWDSNVS